MHPRALPPQDKTHPRSDFSQRGRVRVELKDPATGDPTVEDILNRKQLMQKLSAMIPMLKSRKENPKAPEADELPPGYLGLQGGGKAAGSNVRLSSGCSPLPRRCCRTESPARPCAPQSSRLGSW